MKPQINAARHLADEIARIGNINRRRSSGRMSTDERSQSDLESEMQVTQGVAVPVSPPNDLSGRLLKLVVIDPAAKTDIGKSRSAACVCALAYLGISEQAARTQSKSS